MPVRRMTAARMLQINRWQIAGSKARALNLMSSGGRVTIPRRAYTNNITRLYHQTTPNNASKIVAGQQFKLYGTKGPKSIFFSNKSRSPRWYGGAEVSVRVPRQLTKLGVAPYANGEQWRMAGLEALKGRKITRTF